MAKTAQPASITGSPSRTFCLMRLEFTETYGQVSHPIDANDTMPAGGCWSADGEARQELARREPLAQR
ncbi:MAG: hypothetical protein FHP92_12910 [Denitromonas halophila]|nr:MAG: hypothetical protein FHP92_12910 [Denitromonas halophila]